MQELSTDMSRLKDLKPNEFIIIDVSKENQATTQAARWGISVSVERQILIGGTKKNPTAQPVVKITKL